MSSKSFTPSRASYPTASSKRILSSPLSPEDQPTKKNKIIMASKSASMDLGTGLLEDVEPLSHEMFEQLKSSLHGDILKSIRDDLRSIVKDAITEVIDDKLREIKDDNTKLKKDNKALKKRVKKLETAMDDAEQYSRRNCLRISKMTEQENEDTDQLVLQVAETVGAAINLSDIDRSHRLGKPGNRLVRDIIVRFTSYRARAKLMSKRSNLKTSELRGVYVNEDLTRLRSKLLFEARNRVKAKRLLGAWSSDGRVLVKNKKDKVSLITCIADITKAVRKGESETDSHSESDDGGTESDGETE